MRILVVNPQEGKLLTELGLRPYGEWIASVARLAGSQIDVVDVADGADLPGTIEAHGIIGGGSVHAAYEDLRWIYRTKEFYRSALRQGIPQLHICWSHQAQVMALGGDVGAGANGRRVGIEELRLTAAGRQDPLFAGLPDTFELFTSHVDVATRLPQGQHGQATELAFSSHYRHEALAFGSQVRTFQPHPEVAADHLIPLARMRRDTLASEGIIGPGEADFEDFLTELREADQRIRKNNMRIFENWLTRFAAPFFLMNPLPSLTVG
ncbi:type 1 glutamine amidotransferase [Nonomuraea sp. NPDC049709]|uniref:type 1 glutamine amidotransferase n=1 Tax=Nonomuraea sp. NPDC049709 TaxID=3154736 RepID=UPI00342DB928